MSDTQTFDIPTQVMRALSSGVPSPAVENRLVWHCTTVSTLEEVEEVFDQAERDGSSEFNMTVLGQSRFVLYWR